MATLHTVTLRLHFISDSESIPEISCSIPYGVILQQTIEKSLSTPFQLNPALTAPAAQPPTSVSYDNDPLTEPQPQPTPRPVSLAKASDTQPQPQPPPATDIRRLITRHASGSWYYTDQNAVTHYYCAVTDHQGQRTRGTRIRPTCGSIEHRYRSTHYIAVANKYKLGRRSNHPYRHVYLTRTEVELLREAIDNKKGRPQLTR
jgi:hypothetical protein